MKKEKEKEIKIEIFTPEDCLADMLYDLEHGLEKGETTHIPMFDEYWTWRKSEFNIWSGYSNEGKSEFLKFLCLIKGLEKQQKFCFNSPEDYPAKSFYDGFIHTLSGKTTDKSNLYNKLITKDEYIYAHQLIAPLFKFIYIKPPNNTIENCIAEFQRIHDEDPQNVFILDPIMKFQKSREAPDKPDEYMTYIVTLLTDFARVNNVSVHLVIHQVTPKVNEGTGLYPIPSMYSIRGGGSGADGTDNVLFIQRPRYAVDKIDSSVLFGSQKIKKQKLVGIPGKIEFAFNRKTNRYTEMEGKDLYDFDKFWN